MRKSALIALFVFQSLCFSSDCFVLQSELLTSLSGSSPQSTYTHYRYDANGLRSETRVFDGVDSAALLMSSVEYRYDAQGRCSEEILLSASGDTLSIVNYVYSASGIVSAATLRKDGSLRFRDSLIYDNGVLIEQRRYNATGGINFLHRYTYSAGLLLADSLCEPADGGSFAATQVRILDYNNENKVASEIQSRLVSGQWFVISTTVMDYNWNLLVSAAKYENDGASRRLQDSLSYAYDQWGNRTKEERFSSDRELVQTTDYVWEDLLAVGIAGTKSNRNSFQVYHRNGRINFSTPFSGQMAVYYTNGRSAYSRRLNDEKSFSISRALPSGKYLVKLTGNFKQTFSINVFN